MSGLEKWFFWNYLGLLAQTLILAPIAASSLYFLFQKVENNSE